MPGAPIGICLWIGHLGQGEMSPPTLGLGSRPVDGRSDERMTEANTGADPHEVTGSFQRASRDVDLEPVSRQPQQGRISHRLAGCDNEELPRLIGKRCKSVAE